MTPPRLVLTCIRCANDMDNISPKGFQPSGGLAFHTYGHYGSSFFDPLDGTCIQIAVCDNCLEAMRAAISEPTGYNEAYDWNAMARKSSVNAADAVTRRRA